MSRWESFKKNRRDAVERLLQKQAEKRAKKWLEEKQKENGEVN